MRCGMRRTKSARPSYARAPSSASSVQSSSRELSANAVLLAKRLPRELCREIYGFEIELPPLDTSVANLKAWMRIMRKKAEEGREERKARRER